MTGIMEDSSRFTSSARWDAAKATHIPRKSVKRRRSLAALTEATKASLEDLSVFLMDAWYGSLGPESDKITRQWTAADFTHENKISNDSPFPPAQDLDEFIATIRALKSANSDWQVHAFNFTASIDREHNHAVVWFTSGASGNPGNSEDWSTNRESVSKLYWRKRPIDGEWECYKHVLIRGGGAGPDMF